MKGIWRVPPLHGVCLAKVGVAGQTPDSHLTEGGTDRDAPSIPTLADVLGGEENKVITALSLLWDVRHVWLRQRDSCRFELVRQS